MKYALVNAANEVVNVVELDFGANYVPPEGHTLVEGRDWPVIAPVSVLPPQPPSFVARALLAELSDADTTAIQNAITASAPMRRLWWSLLGQGDAPIETNADRFVQGWGALTSVLGQQRAAELAAALGIV